MEFVTNGYAIEKYSLDFIKRLTVKNARLYQKPVMQLAMLQSDAAYMANEIFVTNKAEYQVRRIFLGVSMAALHALDKRMADVYEVLMVNPSEAFNRQNGRSIPEAEAVKILDNLSENLGVMIDDQDTLLKGVRDKDRERAKRLPDAAPELDSIFSSLAESLSGSLINLFL